MTEKHTPESSRDDIKMTKEALSILKTGVSIFGKDWGTTREEIEELFSLAKQGLNQKSRAARIEELEAVYEQQEEIIKSHVTAFDPIRNDLDVIATIGDSYHNVVVRLVQQQKTRIAELERQRIVLIAAVEALISDKYCHAMEGDDEADNLFCMSVYEQGHAALAFAIPSFLAAKSTPDQRPIGFSDLDPVHPDKRQQAGEVE